MKTALRNWLGIGTAPPMRPMEVAVALQPAPRDERAALPITWMYDGSHLTLRHPLWIEAWRAAWSDLSDVAYGAFMTALRDRTLYYRRGKSVPQGGHVVRAADYRPLEDVPGFPPALRNQADLAHLVLYWEGGLREPLDALAIGGEAEAKLRRAPAADTPMDLLAAIDRRLKTLIRLQGLSIIGQSGVYYGFGETSGMGAVRGISFTATGAQRIFLNEKDRPVGVVLRVSVTSETGGATLDISPKADVPTHSRVRLALDSLGAETPVLVVPARQSLYGNPSATDARVMVVEVDILRPQADDGA